MAKLMGMIFLPGLTILGGVLLLLGMADRGSQGLAIGGCVLLGSVLIAGSLPGGRLRE